MLHNYAAYFHLEYSYLPVHHYYCHYIGSDGDLSTGNPMYNPFQFPRNHPDHIPHIARGYWVSGQFHHHSKFLHRYYYQKMNLNYCLKMNWNYYLKMS
jgi:hypothetical protein